VLTAADQTAAARKDRSLYLFARLKSAVTIEQARGGATHTRPPRRGEFSRDRKGWGAAVRTLPDFLIYYFGIRTALVILMTTVGFVLMIARANVAGLLWRAQRDAKGIGHPHSLSRSPAHYSAIADLKTW
jgi:hypothetical protein